jgi:hypothetical protein
LCGGLRIAATVIRDKSAILVRDLRDHMRPFMMRIERDNPGPPGLLLVFDSIKTVRARMALIDPGNAGHIAHDMIERTILEHQDDNMIDRHRSPFC